MKFVRLIVFSFMLLSLHTSAQQTAESPTRIDEPQLLQQFAAVFEERCSKDLFSGAVLIAKGNQTLFEKACGFADRENKSLNTVDTKFNLGSMNKMFTSVAIAQLVSQERMKYSDKIAGWIPDYPNREAAQKITVEHLLTHASGLADVFTDEFMRDRLKIHTLTDYLPYFANQPLKFEPGTDRSYSNSGFMVAGIIIEKVSGQNYFDYIRKNIYDKAGMEDSFGFGDRKAAPKTAIGYTRDRGTLERNEYALLTGSAAGGGYSTLRDLLKFANALKSGKLVPSQLLPKVVGLDLPKTSTYAYGFNREAISSEIVFGHAGGAEGINGDLDIYWKSGYVVVSLANMDPRAAEEMSNWIRLRIKL
jgi:D-alanyl-D-alanine carboxypeptidase